MKLLILSMMVFSFQAFATQVETDCIAQSENREKIIKTTTKTVRPGTSASVVEG